MKTSQPVFAGIDIGASRTKAVILNKEKRLIGHAVCKSGTNFTKAAEDCLSDALKKARTKEKNIIKSLATGYGRKSAPFTSEFKTEISCHSKGCFHYFPQESTIVDIGGQDNKIIKIDKKGIRTSFKMNRKCAAGTGAFLEEMSQRLDIPIDDMNDLALLSHNLVELGSFCTVFSATEVLEKISKGHEVADIVKGIFLSVIKRLFEMDTFTENVVMTGGVVAHNPIIVTMVEEKLGRRVLVPEYPQFTGALGAAFFAMEMNI